MIKQIFFFLFFFCVLQSYSQKLVYMSNGNFLNSENQKISPDQVRELLKDNEKLLADYNINMSKKKVGNILLFGGIGIIGITSTVIILDFVDEIHLNHSSETGVQAAHLIGLASIIVAIPFKIGHNKKMKKFVNEYNYQLFLGYNPLNNPKLDFITNANGIGLRFTLN